MFKAHDQKGQPLLSFGDVKGGKVTFGDNVKGKIIGIGQVGKKDSTYNEDVLLVNGLKHNLLSISQLCVRVIE